MSTIEQLAAALKYLSPQARAGLLHDIAQIYGDGFARYLATVEINLPRGLDMPRQEDDES